MQLQEKVVIVTGAARGLGKAYAQGIAAEGGKVVVSDILDGEVTAEAICKAEGEAVYIPADVSDGESVERLARGAAERFGRIDGLVNNAALFAGLTPVPYDEHGPFEGVPEEVWDRTFAVNVKGVWLTTKAVYPYMKKGGGGKVVNIASGTHFRGVPKPPHYVVSKGAVITLTRVLARTLGTEGICVNCIAPGLTRSEGILAARGESFAPEEELVIRGRAIPRSEVPGDLVGAVVFFLSAAADFVTGQTLVVDGGAVMQ